MVFRNKYLVQGAEVRLLAGLGRQLTKAHGPAWSGSGLSSNHGIPYSLVNVHFHALAIF